MKDLKKRTITAIVLIIIIVPIIFFGGIFMNIFAGLLTAGAAFELEKMYKEERKFNVYSIVDIIMSVLVYSGILACVLAGARIYILIIFICVFVIEGIMMIFTNDSNIDTLGKSLITIFYPGIGFSSLALLRNVETGLYREGLFLILYVALICMMTDMFAYFVGCKFGKHKLCERISPKKTWEGSIGGTVFGVVIPTVVAYFTGISNFLFPTLNVYIQILLTVLMSLILSFIDEIGDLFASKLKRCYGIKDYSQIFPGHGGVLDRFDSYIFASATIMIYLLIIL